MRETVGLRSYIALYNLHLIKRDALIFRKIGVIGLGELSESCQEWDVPESYKQHLTELPWLIEQGILFDVPRTLLRTSDSLDEETKTLVKNIAELRIRSRDFLMKAFNNDEGKAIRYLSQMWFGGKKEREAANSFDIFFDADISGEIYLRPLSTYYRNIKHIDAYPAIFGKLPELPPEAGNVEDVIQVAINRLPVPDDSTSWEQVLDFRNDPDSEGKFLGLRNWMNDTARAKLTPIEVEQKLEWLLHEYKQHMELHRMKTNVSTLETIVVTGAEIAENLVKLQFGKLAKGLFSLRHRKLALLEGELKSPGREIAFISKAQETFC